MATPLYPPLRNLDERHGTHDPVDFTPDRFPGSVRRTTTIEMLRPDGVRRDLRLHGRGRDLLTAADGTTAILDEADMHVVIDFLDAVSVTESGCRLAATSRGRENGCGLPATPSVLGFEAVTESGVGARPEGSRIVAMSTPIRISVP